MALIRSLILSSNTIRHPAHYTAPRSAAFLAPGRGNLIQSRHGQRQGDRAGYRGRGPKRPGPPPAGHAPGPGLCRPEAPGPRRQEPARPRSQDRSRSPGRARKAARGFHPPKGGTDRALPGPALSARASHRRPPAGHRPGHPGPPGRHHLRRDGLRQEHPDPQDVPRSGARRGRQDRLYPAPPDRRRHHRPSHRRGAGRASGPVGRLQDPVPGPDLARRLHQDHDRRHAPGRNAGRSAAPRIRHAHHRRSPRAEPQHRFPPRHRPDAPRRPSRPQAHHHLGDARHGEVQPAFDGAPVIQVGGRMFPVEVEYESTDDASRRAEDTDYVERAVKAVDKLKSGTAPGDILVFMPTEQDILETCERLEGKHYAGTTILPLYARLPAAQQGRVYSVHGAEDRRRHQRRRDIADHPRHPLRRRHRAWPGSPSTSRERASTACRSATSPGRAPTSARAAAAASRKASASGSTRRRITNPGRSSRRRRSCAPTWPRSSCG